MGLVPAEVVDALFYNFAPGEVARHIPKVWQTTSPEAAIEARQTGCANALRRILGYDVGTAVFVRTADLLLAAATSAPVEGRPMYAVLRTIPAPDDAVVRLFHAASLLREHRGDGHIAVLMVEGVGGLESHVLLALDMAMPARDFGRIHHLPAAQLAAVLDGMRDRGLIGDDGWLSEVVEPSSSASRRGPTTSLRSPTRPSSPPSSTSSSPSSNRWRRDCACRRGLVGTRRPGRRGDSVVWLPGRP